MADNPVLNEPFNWYVWITQSSTIRGIIALATVLGFGGARWANFETLSMIILGIGPLVYGIYNLVRKDSSKVSVILLFLMVPLFMAGTAQAEFLICDPMVGVVEYDIEVDGVVIENIPAEADGSLKYDVSALAAGPHTFRLRPEGQGGWPTTWSAPFDASKPVGVSGIRIVE